MKIYRSHDLKIRTVTALFLSVSLIVINPTIVSATAPSIHKAGRVGTGFINTIRSGKGAPSNSLGIDGDFYIDTVAFNFYGPKISGKWSTHVSMRGPAGANGPEGKIGTTGAQGAAGTAGEKATPIPGTPGAPGSKGETGFAGSKGETGSAGAVGAAGSTGSQGIAGTKGDTGSAGAIGSAGSTGSQGIAGTKGDTGSAGSQGVAGAKGDTGSSGSAGSQGIAGTKGDTGSAGSQGVTGAKGDTGSTGAVGSQGVAGASGPQGVTGNIGAIGPSQVEVIALTPWTLSTATPGTTSSSIPFANLLANKSYAIIIQVAGKLSTFQPSTLFTKLGLAISASDGSAQINYGVTSSYGYWSDGGSTFYLRESFLVVGTITPTANTTLTITVVDAGPTTGSYPMTFSGFGFFQLIGSIL